LAFSEAVLEDECEDELLDDLLLATFKERSGASTVVR
jgi:hypothetical protein